MKAGVGTHIYHALDNLCIFSRHDLIYHPFFLGVVIFSLCCSFGHSLKYYILFVGGITVTNLVSDIAHIIEMVCCINIIIKRFISGFVCCL